MHEAAERRRLRAVLLEQADLVAHRAVAQMAGAQAGLDLLGKGEGRLVATGALGADADDLAVVDVEPAFVNQVGVDHRVEVGVVDDVVHVAVDVVVHPARRDGEEVREAVASLRLVGHGWRTVRSASRVSSRSEEHTSELQSLMRISYAVFCLKKNKTNTRTHLLI